MFHTIVIKMVVICHDGPGPWEASYVDFRLHNNVHVCILKLAARVGVSTCVGGAVLY